MDFLNKLSSAELIAIISAIGALIVALTNAFSGASKKRVDAQIASLEAELVELRASMKTLGDTVKTLQDENARLTKENVELRGQVKMLTDENTALKKKVSDLEHQNAVTQERYEAACKSAEEALAKVNAAKARKKKE
jgi:cell division protein FtsB